ncbi:adenylate/guanylate cyclase domain-containing protein [Bradyrhizobium sp. CB3481]|uniref:adenylate/guanylate cyclase domain-containing protein n=1 Tax=Bradyrhizobium sp. CB3481 TaxID=3039158 RepID=UPI0024B2616E|nr:adenylate/guanylate cyclase domain-containing protein [Bradyrhizobium sp. CB3481]WFU16568.1 adenylate/guanylate cyclase domain-containing protein [Bradyrhizobium sp. CB3481]
MDGPTAQLLERRWGAVLTADVVEYSRLTSLNEEQTYLRYKAHRRELIDPMTAEYRARFVKSTGDGILAEFETALDAVWCAIQVQQQMVERCKGESGDRRIVFRMGLSCGNIIADKEDIYGHDVNVAARLQTVAPAGGIAMTDRVAELVGPSLSLPLEDLGIQKFRNMCLPVRVFQCRVLGEVAS